MLIFMVDIDGTSKTAELRRPDASEDGTEGLNINANLPSSLVQRSDV